MRDCVDGAGTVSPSAVAYRVVPFVLLRHAAVGEVMMAGLVSAAPASPLRAGRFDAMRRRRALRTGRQRGCFIYIAAEELHKAGIALDGPAPFYLVWGSRGGSVLVRLYREG